MFGTTGETQFPQCFFGCRGGGDCLGGKVRIGVGGC